MYQKIKTPILVILSIIVMFFSVQKANEYYRERLIPPITSSNGPYLHNGDGNLLTNFHVKDAFFIRSYTTRIIACRVEIVYSILQMDNDAIPTYRKFWYIYPRSIGTSGVGDFVTDERLTIPDWLPIGKYIFIRQATYLCDDQTIVQNSLPMEMDINQPTTL